MIILPTRKILIERRKKLYDILTSNINHCSVERVEYIMRQIHIINWKLNIYFMREKNDSQI